MTFIVRFQEPAMVDGVVYVAANELVFAVDAESGEELWRKGMAGYVRVGEVLAVADGSVYVPVEDGTVYALDAESGAARWRTVLDPNGSTATSVAVDGERVYAIGGRG